MQPKKVEFPETLTQGRGFMKLQKIIMEFKNSDMDIAELVVAEDEYKSLSAAQGGIKRALVRLKEDKHLKCFTCNGTIYLCKLDLYNKMSLGGK